MTPSRDDNPTVFSTDKGRICPICGQPVDLCTCKKKPIVTNNKDGFVRVRLERKGRGGKTVTLIEGITGNEESLKTFVKDLKRSCGAGGSIKNGLIEIQGDVRDLVKEKLESKGFKVKKAGD
jgi:translation initiation factor 1